MRPDHHPSESDAAVAGGGGVADAPSPALPPGVARSTDGKALPPPIQESPYKGTDSFKVEDRDLFFGREREAVTLTSRILASRCTLLYARSGVGKTSLLNARVIPMLEARGWTPVPVRLDNQPLEAIRQATLGWVVPPPSSEARVVENARDALTGPGSNPTVAELLVKYEALPVRRHERRTLIQPAELPRTPICLGYPASGTAMPFFARLLRRSIDAPRFSEHLRLTAAFAGGPAPTANPAEMRVDELLALLRDGGYEKSWGELIAELTGPVGDLQGFLANLVEVWGARYSHFGLVLLLDQFEELFTLFVDSRLSAETDPGTLPRWQVRKQFLNELEGVYGNRRDGRSGLLPVRLVIGMREEFIAQLDPVRSFVPELDESSFRLSLLDRTSARDAILNPARDFGVSYTAGAAKTILAGLALEEEFVAPVTLQIVCDSLWSELRRRDAQARARGEPPPEPVITDGYIDAVGRGRGVLGILEGFFDGFLASLDDNESRTEALDILSQLITSSGTRNIVMRSELEEVRYRIPGVRAAVMRRLVEEGIVRVERRLGSEFAEVMHEFLIGPILHRVRETLGRDPEYHRLPGALRTLRRWEDRDRGGADTLSYEELEEIRTSVGRLQLPPWAPELLLRSALACGDRIDDFPALVRLSVSWFGQVQGGEPDVAQLVAQIEDHAARRRWFGPAELAVINRHRSGLALRPAQARFVWESSLWRAHAGEEEDLRFWTQTVARHGHPTD
jgi:hypothetical protein